MDPKIVEIEEVEEKPKKKRRRGKSYVNKHANKLLINTDVLSTVPVKGKLVGPKSYIRQSLQPYADNESFAFSNNITYSQNFDRGPDF